MASEIARVDDTILITNESSVNVGKEFIVVGCPYSGKQCECKSGTQTWIFDVNRNMPQLVWLSVGEYSVVKRGEPYGCETRKDIDAYLKRQMNDNLRMLFG